MTTNHHARHAKSNGRASTHAGGTRTEKAHAVSSSRILLWTGIGIAGAGVALAVALAARPRRAFPLRAAGARQRSFLGEAVRQVGLTVLAVLARKLAQQVPLELIGKSEGAALSTTEAA